MIILNIGVALKFQAHKNNLTPFQKSHLSLECVKILVDRISATSQLRLLILLTIKIYIFGLGLCDVFFKVSGIETPVSDYVITSRFVIGGLNSQANTGAWKTWLRGNG